MAGKRGVIFEYVPNGPYIKVSAIDEETGTEVSIVGDARATQSELQRIARMKLERHLDQLAGKSRA
jgi:hypothetical protein